MRRRTFLAGSAIAGMGSALAQLSTLFPAQRAVAADSGEVAVTIRSLAEFERAGKNLGSSIIKGLDLGHLGPDFWQDVRLGSTHFLGCAFRSQEIENQLQARGAFLLRRFDALAYDPYRTTLYTPLELGAKTPTGKTRDDAIYQRYLAQGKLSTDPVEGIARSVHDYSMDDGLAVLSTEIAPTDMVCITGGFFQARTDPWFRKTAVMARLLCLDGKFIVTGGGPGMMEAANLGAYMAGYDEEALDAALAILAQAPQYDDPAWRDRAADVMNRFPHGRRSLGIPTWFYGFEPSNLFASEVAKYFDNDIREGVLMSIAKGGAVFAPGAAGARQEIFMVATQNHFGSGGFFYPMVLFGTDHYQVETHVYQLLRQVANDNYRELVYSTDDAADVVRFIREHPPKLSSNPH